MTAAVRATDLFRVHRTREGDGAALQGLTLEVARGEAVVVLGPSGAGKSSLLRILAGLDTPSAGVAEVLGTDIGRLPGRRRSAFRQAHVGMVDQHHDRALSPDLDCRSIVALGLALRGADRTTRVARADALLERVGLADRANARPAELSGGEQQRVAVCAAVAHRPGLLLADEPGGELDETSARAVYQLIGELAREEGTAVVLVSHDASAADIADRIVRLRDGRISGERRAGEPGEAIVVGRGGWLRADERLRGAAAAAGIALTDAPAEAGDAEATGTSPVPSAARPLVAELAGVSKAYGSRRVLDGFGARFAPGRLTALSGRSGSGKSTVLRLLAGLERPDAGSVLLDGLPLEQRSRAELARTRREAVAVVGQDPGLVDFLSAEENVVLALANRGVADAEARARARETLAWFGVGSLAAQRVHRLSAGERQRVALARALSTRPRLLLADEPTSRLDEANAASVGERLAAAAREGGVTIVCATHEPILIDAADAEVRLEG